MKRIIVFLALFAFSQDAQGAPDPKRKLLADFVACTTGGDGLQFNVLDPDDDADCDAPADCLGAGNPHSTCTGAGTGTGGGGTASPHVCICDGSESPPLWIVNPGGGGASFTTIDADYGAETVTSAWTMDLLTLGGNLDPNGFSFADPSTGSACLGGNGEADILCVSNDGVSSSVVLTRDSTDTGPILRIVETGGDELQLDHNGTEVVIEATVGTMQINAPDNIRLNLAGVLKFSTWVNGIYIASNNCANAPLVFSNDFDNGMARGGGDVTDLCGGAKTSFRAKGSASDVNFVQVDSSVTTAAPVISAEGTDANIDLDLTGKGTGSVSISGCVMSGKLVAAPGSPGLCDEYTDTTNNAKCWYDGAAWQVVAGTGPCV